MVIDYISTYNQCINDNIHIRFIFRKFINNEFQNVGTVVWGHPRKGCPRGKFAHKMVFQESCKDSISYFLRLDQVYGIFFCLLEFFFFSCLTMLYCPIILCHYWFFNMCCRKWTSYWCIFCQHKSDQLNQTNQTKVTWV